MGMSFCPPPLLLRLLQVGGRIAQALYREFGLQTPSESHGNGPIMVHFVDFSLLSDEGLLVGSERDVLVGNYPESVPFVVCQVPVGFLLILGQTGHHQ